MENLHHLSYQFKISVTLQENKQSLLYLEKVMNYIEEFSREEIEILNRLVKNTLHSSEKTLLNLISLNETKENHNENNKNNNHLFDDFNNSSLADNEKVINIYTKYTYTDIITLIERLLSCVYMILQKVKNEDSIILIYKNLGKLNAFLSLYEDTEKSQHLEQALFNYQQAVTLLIKHFEKTDVLRLRVFLSYCKFVAKYLKDYYRSVLFCINVMESLKKELVDKEVDKEIIQLSAKYKQFYQNNIENYNVIISKYYH